MTDAGLRPTGDAGDLATRRADFTNLKWRAVRRRGPLRLGFNSIVAFRDGTPKEAYAKFIDLAVHAESLGYDSASIRVRTYCQIWQFCRHIGGHYRKQQDRRDTVGRLGRRPYRVRLRPVGWGASAVSASKT